MSTQLIICLVIFALTCIGYMTGVWSLGTVAMASLVALSLTGCLAPSEALAYFSNNNVIMIGAMSVVAAGFNRMKFCTDLATGISKMAKGSLSKVLFLVLWLLFVWLLQKAWGFPKPKFLYHLALLPYQPAVHFQLVPVQLRLRN